MGLVDFLFGRGGRSRDGSSPQRAVVVRSIAEEYEWMRQNCRGFRPVHQALRQIDGKPFDVLTWRNDRGEERTAYFDISAFFGR
jgi:hypothetical protein